MGQSLHRLGREQANCDGYGMGLVVVSGLIEHRWMGGMTDVADVHSITHTGFIQHTDREPQSGTTCNLFGNIIYSALTADSSSTYHIV